MPSFSFLEARGKKTTVTAVDEAQTLSMIPSHMKKLRDSR